MSSTRHFMIILLVMMEELCACKCSMSDMCIMQFSHVEYDGDVPFIVIMYCRIQYNDNFNVINSTCHDNSAGRGGAMYL